MLGFTKRQLFYNFLIWSVVALFTASQLYLKSMLDGATPSWLSLFKVQLLVWWVWGLITPLVFRLGNHFRVNKKNAWKLLLIHLPIAVLIVGVYLMIYAVIWNLNTHGTLNLEKVLSIYILLFPNLFHWHFFIYMAIIGMVYAQLYYREAQDQALRHIQLEKDLIRSQLSFLKMQLQPHFLFNTMNSIVSSIHQGKMQVAADMTTSLSELLRISLAGGEQQIISLRKELQHVQMYLTLEKYRFKDLQIEYDIPSDLLEVEVPNFLLQPVLENAIKHGISKQASAKKIVLSAKLKGDRVRFNVFNEGPAPVLSQEGIGLSNIKKRLIALFNEQGKLEIKPYENGTLVSIEIPQS